MNIFNKKSEAIKTEKDETNFWISYADIMAALLLMFILILSIVIFDYKLTLNRQKKELKQKSKKIDELLGLRKKIIVALQEQFDSTDLKLEIDPETGAIRCPGGVFFATDSTRITDNGLNYLSKFVPKYVDILLGKEFKKYVSQIIIEGHTDDRGTFMYNLELSQERALSVVKTIDRSNFLKNTDKKMLLRYLTANGKSFSRPILNENGKINRRKSRRVEFKFRLKDKRMIQELIKTINN